jgi:histidyl-tRNA synthetase
MKNQKSKGMQDLLPEDMLRFRCIEDAFRRCCREWGYKEVRTPTLEYLHLFTATGTLTPSMLGKVYSFLDWDGWSGERVVLRPDGTIPVARLYIDNISEREIARLFYVTNIFAFEETGTENRERWQCGAEFFSGAEFATDVEIILLAEEVIRRLGLSHIELQLSHAGLVKALIKEFKLSPSEEARVTSGVLEGDWQALRLTADSCQMSDVSMLLSSLLSLKGKTTGFLQNVRTLSQQASQNFKSSLEDFINIATLLDSLGCGYEIDITAIRGFEYYTGACFQLLAGGEKIAGGGRYDNLVPLMNGGNIPACGFALYVDSVMKSLPLEEKDKSDILVKGEGLSLEIVETCFTLAGSLRDAGHPTELDFTGREESNYRWVVLVSGGEPSPFVLIDRQTKQQRDVASMAEILRVVGKG